MRHRHWIQVDDSYPHVLTSDMYILLRRRGITCAELDNSLARLLIKPTHLRFNMMGERRSVQQSFKRQPDVDDSDFIDLTVTPKRHKSSESVFSSSPIIVTDSPLPLQVFGITPSPIIVTDSPSPAQAFNITPKQEYVLSMSSPSPSPTFTDLPSLSTSRAGNEFPADSSSRTARTKGKTWLASMYVTDMQKGFLAMDSLELKRLSVVKRLERVFGWPVPPRTFYDQRERWLSATSKEREDALAAGHSQEGLWSAFASNIPLKRGPPSH